MEESPYTFAGSYDIYKNEIDKSTEHETFGGFLECDRISTQYLVGDTNKCLQIDKFLSHLSNYGEKYTSDGCKYLNYWIYDKFNQKKGEGNYNILQFYESFKGTYSDQYDNNYLLNGCIKEIDENIFRKIQNLIDIYDKYNKLKNDDIQLTGDYCTSAIDCVSSYTLHVKKCHESYDPDFCMELENFRKLYNLRVSNVTSCKDLQTYLPSAINSNVVTIITPFAVILVMPFILFILYKFTPFGSWIMPRMKRMLNNSFLESYEGEQNSENANIYAEDRMYNIAYHSA
ncbi:Plasmodium vivax Vir protein, putative [Plasmodium ovale]|uniref:Plasmodium vivax Vir protein, putative n=1 Tax=Plasmodium ovale TaxID=36330 RepID=A0A1C3KGG4_PLAOA|nr:Plasmodium vivax Vir protein, putative [Plasmodium ovale]